MRRWLSAGFASLCLAALATPASASGQLTLSIPVTSFDADSNNVTVADGALRLAAGSDRAASARVPLRTGIAVYQPARLTEAVNTVAAKVDSTGSEVAIDVRAALPDSTWTEWTEIRPQEPAVLSVSSAVIQVRVVLTAPDGVASPEVRGLDLTLSNTASRATAAIQAAGLSYRVYATREGLVGGTTANGHVIVSRDHFVALPSRRGLSNNRAGTYSVQVCASNGRCEWAPVWDVGPWNTTDDYWNPPATRQSWKDLPQGKPEAQAAYQDNYNGGRDQFGRDVANPAGIDLADGTFWDGLKLTDNAWVTVTYLWTGSGANGFVRTAADPVNVRTGPNTTSSIVGLAANYAQVRVECQITGESVTGSQGTSNIWYRIASGKYVARAYVTGVSGATTC